MKPAVMFRILGIVLFVQLALGGLVTFGYLGPFPHLVWGVILGLLAVAALVFVYRLPSKPKQLVGITFGIGLDVLLQGVLGVAILRYPSEFLSWIHFLNALAIFGMTLSGTFMVMAAGRMADAPQGAPQAQG